jgi:hypothetical protein
VGGYNGKPNVYCATEIAVPRMFGNIGEATTDGVPYQPWAAELVKTTRANNRPNDPLSHCLPTGIVRLHTFPLFRKVIQFPGLLVILNELNATFRQIFTDGGLCRSDPEPVVERYSSVEREGDTLVVQTTGFRDGLWLHGGQSSRMPPGSRNDSGA